MRKNIVLAVLLFFSVPAVAQIQALKGLASLAIPDAGLEEIHGEVVALTSDVGKDVEILNAINAGYPFLPDSIEAIKRRAAACGITIDVRIGTEPPLSYSGYTMTAFDEEKYNKLSKVKKLAYLSKVHKALRDEHARYSSVINIAVNKIEEILAFLEDTDRQVKAAEKKKGGAQAAFYGLDDAGRMAIKHMKKEVAGVKGRS